MSYIGKLKIGTEVLVSNKEKFTDKKAVVKFIGKLPGKPDEFIGVQLQTADGAHSGVFQNKEYFKAKQNHGMFAKPKAVKLLDGTPIQNLLTGKTKPTTSQARTTKPGVTTAKKNAGTQNTLSNQLKDAQNNQQVQKLKEQLQQANKKIQTLQTADSQQELVAMRNRIRELEDQNRQLKINQQKAKLQSSESQDEKTKELQQKIDFFNAQKQHHQKEKADLKKKITRLEEELEESQGNLQEFEKLTFKMESLEAKNLKLKEELESTKTQLRNAQMLGGSGEKKQSQGTSEQLQEMKQNVKVLNQTISLLQGDLNEQKQKTIALEKQLQQLKSKSGDVTKLEKKLKSRDEELQALKNELQACGDAAQFAEKLTLDMLRKEQQLKQSNSKLSQYLKKIEDVEVELSQAKQMIQLQTQQLQTQEDEIQKVMNQKQQQQNHITELMKQMGKYKAKIAQLTQNNESLQMTTSQILDQSVMNQDESMFKTYMNSDVYQHKYFEAIKYSQALQEMYIDQQLQSFQIKNLVGTQMLNLFEAIPQSYTQQLYPSVINKIVQLKTTTDKLYLLFDTASSYIKNRSDIYSKQNIQLAQWIVMLLEQVPLLYGQLTKIQLSLTTADNQQEVSDILSNTILRELVKKIDYFCTQLLQRFAQGNIDPSIDLSPLIDPVQNLDQVCGQGRKLQYEHETRNKLCVQTMATIHKIFSMIVTFKQTSQLGQSAQIDTMLQNFLKSLLTYLRECCTNPYIRIKSQTKQYLSGLQLIIKIFEEIQINQTVVQLSSLYSETQDIKMLKETLLTTQFHLKELINDLNEIVYPSVLSKIKCPLPGKVWLQKSKTIKDQLSRFNEVVEQKQELQSNLIEAKKKTALLEKDIKNNLATKELYEKRIGQLQLKVQQASSLENELKRQTDKVKSYEDTNKLIEDELQTQVNRKKEFQDQVRKLKEKLQSAQTQHLIKNRRQKTALSSAGQVSAEEVTSLTIFKNVLAECHSLRTMDLKKKVLQLKQSPILAKPINPQLEKQKSNLSHSTALRRKVMHSIVDLKITNPREKKPFKEQSDPLTKIKAFEWQAQQLKFAMKNLNKESVVEMKIGSFMFNKSSMQKSDKFAVKIDQGHYKVMSY